MSWRERLRDERGISLMELVVGMAMGIVVVGALLAISEEGLRLTVRASDQVDANQRGRAALQEIVALLHSSCVVASSAPIQASSTGTQLWFVAEQTGTSTSGSASVDSGAVVTPAEYEINYASNTLTETEYPLSSSSTPSAPSTWTFTTTGDTTRTLLTNVAQSNYPSSNQPIFQYYEYNSSGELPLLESTNGVQQPVPYSSTAYYIPGVSTPLTSASAPDIAAVTINYVAFPTDGSAGTAVSGTEGDRTVNLNDSVVLRFTTASSTVVNDVPCQ